MIILTDSKDIAINSNNVLYYKIVEVPDGCVLRAYFGKEESVLVAKGAKEYLRQLIQGIAQKSSHSAFMEI